QIGEQLPELLDKTLYGCRGVRGGTVQVQWKADNDGLHGFHGPVPLDITHQFPGLYRIQGPGNQFQWVGNGQSCPLLSPVNGHDSSHQEGFCFTMTVPSRRRMSASVALSSIWRRIICISFLSSFSERMASSNSFWIFLSLRISK